jgi:hypothetical protein
MPEIHVCSICLPAGDTSPSLDDNRGTCYGCGQHDGNRHRVTISAALASRGYYATSTGALRGPETRL